LREPGTTSPRQGARADLVVAPGPAEWCAAGTGPAVIEEAASVTLVGPDDTVEVNAFGHLVMRLAVTP